MKTYIKKLSLDKAIWWSIILSTVFLFLSILFIVFTYSLLPPVIPIFNQLPWGTERLVTKIGILIPVGFSFIYLITNIVLTHVIYERSAMLGRMLNLSSLLMSTLTTIFVFKTIQLIL
ncbi:MAG: hypothetical protein HZC02_03635 [Candidatus Levybacteria bacterium]|nr:hypothetical protein [Candidatus Levybacteria bacterium]